MAINGNPAIQSSQYTHRDLVIKDNDIVLGTHGRGFWIMDDIQPLRQWTKDQSLSEIKLYKPADAIRSISNAEIQYYLPKEVDSVEIEILTMKKEAWYNLTKD